MVVVVLVGILTTLAVINLGGNPALTRLEKEMGRIGALLKLAGDEAVLQTRDIGFRVTLDSYEFFIYEPDLATWTRVDFDPMFRRRALPEGLEIDIRLDDLDAFIPESEDDEPAPQVVFFSSGDVTPFALVLDSEDAKTQITLRADALGRTEVEHDYYGF